MQWLLLIAALIAGFRLWYTHLLKKGWERWSSAIVGAVMSILAGLFAPQIVSNQLDLYGRGLAVILTGAILFAPLSRLWHERRERSAQGAASMPATQVPAPPPSSRLPPSPSAPPDAPASAAVIDSQAPDALVIEDKSSGRRALRQMCREALADKAISLDEAQHLLEAFQAYCKRFPNNNAHIEYLRYTLATAVEDGNIDPEESQELVTSLGEFADFGLYGPISELKPARATPPPAPAPAVRQKKPRAPRTRATSAVPRVRTDGRYLIEYVDIEGVITTREVKAKRIERRGEHLYLVSYCLSARAPRTFRVDRVRSMVDADTGEILM